MTDVLPIVWPRTGQIQFATTDSLPFWMGVGWRILDLDGDGNPDVIGGGSSTPPDELPDLVVLYANAKV